MNAQSKLAFATVILLSLATLGCRKIESLDASALAAKAGDQISTQNLSIGGVVAGRPEAELTPSGDLLIGGRKVDVSVG